MSYKNFTSAHGRAFVWVHVHSVHDIPVKMEKYQVEAIDPDRIQRMLWLLSDVSRVTIEVDCLCQYTISEEHHGISRACGLHICDQVVGYARY